MDGDAYDVLQRLAEAEAERDEARRDLAEAEEAIRHADSWWQETYHTKDPDLDVEPCGDDCEACKFEKHPAVRRALERKEKP
jgi:hypothetical protein